MKKKIDKKAAELLKTQFDARHTVIIDGYWAEYFFDHLSFDDMENVLSDYIGKPVRVDEESTPSHTHLIIRIKSL